ncbi:hypothetical protein N7448_006877 [Penicillium atrosanguineum]|nr:hypothetical protein N7448_006877 [Penicillium atrosanguineum]
MTMEDPPQNPPGEGLANQRELPTVQVSSIPAQAALIAESATTLRNGSGAVRSETKNAAKIAIPANARGSPRAIIGGSLELANHAGRAKQNAVVTPQFVDNVEN